MNLDQPSLLPLTVAAPAGAVSPRKLAPDAQNPTFARLVETATDAAGAAQPSVPDTSAPVPAAAGLSTSSAALTLLSSLSGEPDPAAGGAEDALSRTETLPAPPLEAAPAAPAPAAPAPAFSAAIALTLDLNFSASAAATVLASEDAAEFPTAGLAETEASAGNSDLTPAGAPVTLLARPSPSEVKLPPAAPAVAAPSESAPGARRAASGREELRTRAGRNAEPAGDSAQRSGAANSAPNSASGADAKPMQTAALAVSSEAVGALSSGAASPGASPTDALVVPPLSSEASRSPPTAAAHPALRQAPETAIQVYARIVERFDGRAQRFDVRLDPAELGRVHVRIEIGADQKVHAVLAAHDSAALSDLMRGARALEQSLTDAGLDLAEGGLRFELSSDAGGSRGDEARSHEDRSRWPHALSVGAARVEIPESTDAGFRPGAFRWGSPRLDLLA